MFRKMHPELFRLWMAVIPAAPRTPARTESFAGSRWKRDWFSAARRVSWNKFDHGNAIKVTQHVRFVGH
jgi:hypothetical protein